MIDQFFIYRSEQIANLTQAMIEFHKIMDSLVKNAKGQFDYASLDAILYHVIPKLAACNIQLEQSDMYYGEDVFLRTAITHNSGEFKASYDYLYPKSFMTTLPKNSQAAGAIQQTLGSIKSYQCRYALKSFLCIPIMDPDFDDNQGITEDQANALYDMANGNQTILDTFMDQLGIESSMDIKPEDYDAAVEIMKLLCNKGK
jgi:hypothetical protein